VYGKGKGYCKERPSLAALFGSKATESKKFIRVILYGRCNASKIKWIELLNSEDGGIFFLWVIMSCGLVTDIDVSKGHAASILSADISYLTL